MQKCDSRSIEELLKERNVKVQDRFLARYRTEIEAKVVQTSSDDTKSQRYNFRNVWTPAGEGTFTKYFMIQTILNDSFSESESTRLRDIFRKFANVISDRALWTDNPNAFYRQIPNPRRRLDIDREYLHWCSLAPIRIDEIHQPDAVYLYIFVIGMMTNYMEADDPTYCSGKPTYFPIYLERYERPQEADGSWQTGYAPLYQHFFDTATMQIYVNATALNNAGYSDGTWAASMFHEIMHNIGWEHPDGYDDRRQFMLAAQDVFYDYGGD